jgi:hypothetical protein
VSELESQTHPEDSDLDRALGRALKFNAVDLVANRNGELGRRQRLRLLVRGSLLLLFLTVLTAPTALAYMSLQGSNGTKLVLLIVVAELVIYLVIGARGVKMLMDVFLPHALRHTGKLSFGDALQPACTANFIDDGQNLDLSYLRMFFEGLDAYLIDWTREPNDIGIRLPCELVGSSPKDRRCVAYYSRWAHRLLAIELEPPSTVNVPGRKGKARHRTTTTGVPPHAGTK